MKYDSLYQIVSNYKMGILSEWASFLKELSKKASHISFYRVSKETYSFWDFVSKHVKICIKYVLPLDIGYDVALLYDSKSKFRKNIGTYSGLTLPYVVTNSSNIKTDLYKFYVRNVPCINKAEYSVGGYGNIIFNDFTQSYKLWPNSLQKGFKFAPYLLSNHVIIEELIPSLGQGGFSGFRYISEDYFFRKIGYGVEIRNEEKGSVILE